MKTMVVYASPIIGCIISIGVMVIGYLSRLSQNLLRVILLKKHGNSCWGKGPGYNEPSRGNVVKITKLQRTTTTQLRGIAWLSKQDKQKEFDRLIHHINVSSLKECFNQMSGSKAIVANCKRNWDNTFNAMNCKRKSYICNEVVKEASASFYSHFEGSWYFHFLMMRPW